MKTLPMHDHLSQAADRADRECHEKFMRDTQEFLRKQQETKERKEKEDGTPAESTAPEK